MHDLSEKMGQATKWSSITEISVKLIAPITNMILARLLIPEDFGIVATLTLVVSFAEIFTDGGFQKYLVQHEFQDEDDLNANTNVAFWSNLSLSLLLWAGITCFATPITKAVGSEGNETEVITMCLQIPILAFSSIQMARFRRDFDFKSLFIVRVMTALVPLVITVPLAIVFRSHWALVVGTLTRDVINAVLLTVKSRWKPSFYFSWGKLKQMMSFSLWTMFENVVIWLNGCIGTFIVGNVLSEYYLGLYKTTISTANAYTGLITSAITPVLFSGLSRCQDNEKELKQVFFQFQRRVAVLLIPMGAGVLVYRNLATRVLLGSQWMETADFLGLWCMTSVLTILFSRHNNEMFRSLGKPKLAILVQLLHLAFLIPCLVWASDKGYMVLTTVRSLSRLQIIPVSSIVLRITLKIKTADMIKAVWPSICATLIMVAVGVALQLISANMVWNFLGVLVCVIVYAVVMLLIPAGRRQLSEISLVDKILRL